MPLFHVQDDERPMFVIASDFAAALVEWTAMVAKENEDDPDIDYTPQGISHLGDDDEILIDEQWLESTKGN